MKVFSKISLPVSLAIALSVVAVAFFSNWYLKEQLFNEMYLERKDDALRSSKAFLDVEMFRNPQTEESQEKFSRYMDSLRAGDVIRMTVWDMEGRVLASDLLSIVGQKAVRHPELYAVYDTKRVVFLEKKFDNNDPLQSTISPLRIALIPLSLGGRFEGVVEIHMTNLIIGQTISRSVYSIAGLLLATGILLILSMIFLVRRVIIEPLHDIADASEKISQGNFDTRIDVGSKDEIGALAKVFIKMRDDLRTMIVELKTKQEKAEAAEKKERVTNKKLEAEKEELQKFKLAADNSFDHVIISDPDGKILYANVTAERLTGYTFEEMKGKTPALWGKQMPPAFYEEFWHVIKEEKKPYVGELTNMRKDGRKYTASIRVSPILDEKKNVRFFVGVEQDVTAIREHEEMEKRHVIELETVNQKVTTEKVRAEGILRYLRSIGEGVYATDRRGTIVFCNATAAAMVGRSAEELIGESSAAIFHFCIGADVEVCDFVPYTEAIEKERSLSFAPKTFLVEQGKHTPVSGTFSPIVEVDHIAGAIVVFQDITERYELEQMKDRFLSVAAHQLRTPLGSMRWTMELLEDGDLGKLPKQAVSAVQDLHQNSERMMNLVNDLLNVSRIDQSSVKEIPEETDLGTILAEVLKILNGEAEKKKIRFVVTQPKEVPPKITLIQKHIFEAVENLVSNAIRYGKEGGEVKCAIAIVKERLVLSVADDGIGIPKEDQPKLFAKFFRASNAVKSFTDGSGLGLSVVKAYVEESGGEVFFESEENIGTTFSISFPLITLSKDEEKFVSEKEKEGSIAIS